MIDLKKSGFIVQTKTGKLGRTFNEKRIINGKVPVYLAITTRQKLLPDGTKMETPETYSDKAILCSPEGLKTIGFID